MQDFLFIKTLRIGGGRLATGAIPLVQRVISRVLWLYNLLVRKSNLDIRVGSELRDMRRDFIGLWSSLYVENFHYFPKGALEVRHYHLVTRV